jgi:hypothetical protein
LHKHVVIDALLFVSHDEALESSKYCTAMAEMSMPPPAAAPSSLIFDF